MSPVVLAADLDGTLAFAGRSPGPAVIAALTELAARADVRLVLATSRPPRDVRAMVGPLARRADLLCCNGALVVRRGRTVTRSVLPAGLLRRMVSALLAGHAEFCLEYGGRFVASSAEAMPWMGQLARCPLPAGAQPALERVVKLAVARSDRWLAPLRQLAGEKVELYPHNTTGDFDVSPAGVTKAAALARLLADTGAEPATVVAFGNDVNDYELIARADAGVVVGTLLPGLDAARHVRRIPAGDESVAAALREEIDRARARLARIA